LIDPIRNLLAESVITAPIDELMAIASLVMIFIYSPLLATIVLVEVML
jgi:ATP-binding cassette subfamily B protein RaxB